MKLKHLGYLSYGFCLIVIIQLLLTHDSRNIGDYVTYIITGSLILIFISQILFINKTLKTLKYKSFEKIDSIDEYLTLGVDENAIKEELSLIWKSIGWTAIIIVLLYSFDTINKINQGRYLNIITALLAICTVIYNIRVINRKWINTDKKPENEEL